MTRSTCYVCRGPLEQPPVGYVVTCSPQCEQERQAFYRARPALVHALYEMRHMVRLGANRLGATRLYAGDWVAWHHETKTRSTAERYWQRVLARIRRFRVPVEWLHHREAGEQHSYTVLVLTRETDRWLEYALQLVNEEERLARRKRRAKRRQGAA